MRKHYFILIIVMLYSFQFGIAQVSFQNRFTTDLWGRAAQPTLDGGYILLADQPLTSDIYSVIIKIDSLGHRTKSIVINGNFSLDQMYSIQQTFDSGYVLCGFSQNGDGWEKITLIRLDVNLDTVWTSFYNTATNEEGLFASQTSDSGFVLTGLAGFNFLLIKTDKMGNTQMGYMYNSGRGRSVRQTTDGGYIITGDMNGGAFMARSDASGNILWCSEYDSIAGGQCIQQTNDGGFIITGKTTSTNRDVYLIKTNSVGDTLWTRGYGLPASEEIGMYVQQTNDGGYIVTGDLEVSSGISKIYLLKTDSLGSLLWSHSIGTNGGRTVHQTKDGGYAVGAFGPILGGVSAMLIKTDSLGNNGCNSTNPGTIVSNPTIIKTSVTPTRYAHWGEIRFPFFKANINVTESYCLFNEINSPIKNNHFTISPNPLVHSSQVTAETNLQDGELIIFNMLGKEIRREKIFGKNFEIERGKLFSGIYLLQIITTTQKLEGKLVVE